MILQPTRATSPTVIAVACLLLCGGQLRAESPWYVAARLGDASVDARLGSGPTNRIDDEATVGAVEVGYSLNRHLAVELGYQDLGSHAGFSSPCPRGDEGCVERLAALGLCAEGFDCTEVRPSLAAKVDGVSIALVPIWPIGEHLSLRGKAGLIAWDTDVTVERGFLTTAASRTTPNGELFSSRDLLAGLGVQYDFPNGLGLLLQHETFDLDARTTSLGVSWRF